MAQVARTTLPEVIKSREIANDALFYAQRLVQMNKQSQKIRTMQSKEIAPWIEDMLHQTTTKLSRDVLGFIISCFRN